MSDPPSGHAAAPIAVAPERIAPLELFLAFSEMALSGFGGVLPFAYRAMVERRRWVDREEFARLLAVAPVMPGPTICNLAVIFGYRRSGLTGRSEEHTSELQSLTNLVCRLLLEKKKKTHQN